MRAVRPTSLSSFLYPSQPNANTAAAGGCIAREFRGGRVGWGFDVWPLCTLPRTLREYDSLAIWKHSPPSLTSAAPFPMRRACKAQSRVVCRPVIGPLAPAWTPLIPPEREGRRGAAETSRLKGKGGQMWGQNTEWKQNYLHN